MATAKKNEPELPLEPIEPPPATVDDIEFEVEIIPEVVQGKVQWYWQLIRHTAKPYIGDFTALKSDRYFDSAFDTEADARRKIDRVRNVVGLKLTLPEGYKVTL